jgi:fluoride exporter
MSDERPATGSTHPLPWTTQRWVLLAIAVGGMLGASSRRALELAWPTDPAQFPWSTFVTNVAGSALIGLLMVYGVERGAGHPLLRPFLGVGVLGGFTTFSTYAVQTTDLLRAGEPMLALTYLFGTLAVALASVGIGLLVGRRVLAWICARRAGSGGSDVR